MSDHNNVTLVGRLTRDPEMGYTPNQTAVTKFGLANNRKWKPQGGELQEQVSFIDCTSFGKQAETLNQYLAKGSRVLVSGRLQQDRWQDRETQANRSKIVVIVERFQFLDTKADAQAAQQAAAPQQKGFTNPAPPAAASATPPVVSYPDDEIPF